MHLFIGIFPFSALNSIGQYSSKIRLLPIILISFTLISSRIYTSCLTFILYKKSGIGPEENKGSKIFQYLGLTNIFFNKTEAARFFLGLKKLNLFLISLKIFKSFSVK